MTHAFHRDRAAAVRARPVRRLAALIAAAAAGLLLGGVCVRAEGVPIPNFWDPRAGQDRPELSGTRTIRFLTDDDFPPLQFAGPDGAPTGFSVELARAACERLAVTCTVQARRFDTLLTALQAGQGDVVAAAVPITAGLRKRFTMTLPYFRTPARFAIRKDGNQIEPSPKTLEGRTVAVVGGTAHEAYLTAFFPGAAVRAVPDLAAAEAALLGGEVDYVFGDGLGLALWLGGTTANGCCGFAGGPYLESRFFGEGIGFVFRPDDEPLRRAFDYALHRLWVEGKYAELYLRFFPISPF